MGFERCHPAVNFLYFAAVIAGTILFQHPVFLAISVVCAFLYSIKRSGWKAAIFYTVLLIFAVGFALYYSSYHHFGVTVLRQNFIGNNMTLEALVYGFVLGLSMTGVMIWFSCVHSVFTTDKVVYLFGRISPRLSLFLAILRQLDMERVQFAKNIEDFSEGQKKKVLIAASLLTQAHLYIWDEPLNYIDVFSRMQIEKLLLAYRPTMLFVEHDVRFREKIATKVIEL